jgi:hypothetical protein
MTNKVWSIGVSIGMARKFAAFSARSDFEVMRTPPNPGAISAFVQIL